MMSVNQTLQNILCVDDDEDIRTILKLALESNSDWCVMPCSSGVDAMTQLKKHHFDLVLLDVMMPGQDGVSLLAEIRQQISKTVPVIFLTAKANIHDREAYIRAGALDIIVKPFDPLKIHEQIMDIWRGRYA